MKKLLMTMTLLLTLGMGAQSVAQNHRHTPREQEELVDSTSKNAVEAYSDTTSAAASAADGWDDENWSNGSDDNDLDERVLGKIDKALDSWDAKDTVAVLFLLGIPFIIFVLAPILIIVLLFYFINRNRKQKMKLAQMAVEQGQPIPEQLLEDKVNNVTDEFQKGLRQCFVGVGLMIFLGLCAEEVGFGIGALVFCIGLGKVVGAKMAEKKQM